MSAPGQRDPRRPDVPRQVTLGVAIVGLLAVAALALQARHGLDWAELADPVDVRWSRVLLGVVLFALVAHTLSRLVLRRLRRPAMRRDPSRAEPEGELIPLWLRVAAGLLIVAGLALGWFILSSVEGPTPPPPARRPHLILPGGAPPPAPDTSGTATVLLVVAGGLVLAVLVARWLAARAEPPPLHDPDALHDVDVTSLAAAVDAAASELQSHADPRAAVLAAYAAMARRLEGGLARRGRSARTSDTATQLLERSVAAGLVTAAPAGGLTELFREARFSRHPIGPTHRAAAEGFLARVRDELAVAADRRG